MMKKYMICLYLFLMASAVCFVIGYTATRAAERRQAESAVCERDVPEESTVYDAKVVNQQHLQHRAALAEEYYLVSEDGFLLVFAKNQESVCLYTHIPIMELPQEEQDRLREGIWFPSMAELFQYLESCTS